MMTPDEIAADRAELHEVHMRLLQGPARVIPMAPPAAKRLATLKARAALQGIVLHDLEGDDGAPEYVVSRWAMTRAFRSLDELETWLERVEGKRP